MRDNTNRYHYHHSNNNKHQYQYQHQHSTHYSSMSSTPIAPIASSSSSVGHCQSSSPFNNGNNDGAGDRSKATLTPEQVQRLLDVIDQEFEVNGRGNFPTLKICLRRLIRSVCERVQAKNLQIKRAKMNGGAASYVLAAGGLQAASNHHFGANKSFGNEPKSYGNYPKSFGNEPRNFDAKNRPPVRDDLTFSDVDVIFDVDLNPPSRFDGFKEAVLAALLDFLPEGANKDKITSLTMKDAYVRKMVKIHSNGDLWSLITLNNHMGRCIELKFVDKIRRQFEFSVDSFQIHLDWLLVPQPQIAQKIIPVSSDSSADGGTESSTVGACADSSTADSSISAACHSDPTTTDSAVAESSATVESFVGADYSASAAQPEVTAESMFGDFHVALRHLNHKLIDTVQPELIRGGGLLKYVHLLTRGYKPARNPREFRRMERYMCSRFFIDFSSVDEQERKLRAYLDNHMRTSSIEQKYNFLSLLYHVVDDSTVCLMNHERRSSLELIGRLAFEVETELYYQDQLRCANFVAATTNSQQHLLNAANYSAFMAAAAANCSAAYSAPPSPFDDNNNNNNANRYCYSNSNSGSSTPSCIFDATQMNVAGGGTFIDLVNFNPQHQQGHVISTTSAAGGGSNDSPFKHAIIFVPHNASFWIPVV